MNTIVTDMQQLVLMKNISKGDFNEDFFMMIEREIFGKFKL